MDFIKRAAAEMIREKFGEGFEIYTEMIEQGFERPCFFIDAAKGYISRILGGGRLFCFRLDIYYYPEGQEGLNEKMQLAAAKLFQGCENISSDKWRLKYLSGEYSAEKDRLVFSAEFKIKIDRKEETELMERLIMEGGTTDEGKRGN